MSRRNARETAMKMLYRYNITSDLEVPDFDEEDGIYGSGSLNEDDKAYIAKVMDVFPANMEEIDGIIAENSHSWKIERISKVDLSILRLALLEINMLGTPPKVAVNEAVELAKKYSSEKSYKYVNGLLGGCLKSRAGEQ